MVKHSRFFSFHFIFLLRNLATTLEQVVKLYTLLGPLATNLEQVSKLCTVEAPSNPAWTWTDKQVLYLVETPANQARTVSKLYTLLRNLATTLEQVIKLYTLLGPLATKLEQGSTVFIDILKVLLVEVFIIS
jgi:hypothetical protein